MEEFVKGEIVALTYPFSDLSGAKKRPALVVKVLNGDDLILSQITSKNRNDGYSIILNNLDFELGKLPIENSIIRTNVLFTGDRSLIFKRFGKLNNDKFDIIKNKIIEVIS